MKHMSEKELAIYKARIKAARKSGKSEIAKALCEYVLYQNTLSYFKEQEKRGT